MEVLAAPDPDTAAPPRTTGHSRLLPPSGAGLQGGHPVLISCKVLMKELLVQSSAAVTSRSSRAVRPGPAQYCQLSARQERRARNPVLHCTAPAPLYRGLLPPRWAAGRKTRILICLPGEKVRNPLNRSRLRRGRSTCIPACSQTLALTRPRAAPGCRSV